MKYIKYLLIMFLISIVGITSVFAKNSINRIDVILTLDEKGNGKITEIWDVDSDEGTEYYKPIGNLGNSTLSNFKVSMDGRDFTYQDKWDIDASKSKKAYKNGINYTSDGFELCFGISDYGKHKYTITYDVTNLVYNTNDSQFIYWKFINDSMDPAPAKFSVKVIGPFDFPSVNENISHYKYVLDDYIEKVNNEITNIDVENYTILEDDRVYCEKVIYDNNKVSYALGCTIEDSSYTYEYYDYLGSTVSLEDSVAVWGYGYRGYAYAANGIIEMSNEDYKFYSSDYAVLLARFSKGTFNTKNELDGYNDFASVYGMSKEGSYNYSENTSINFFDKLIAVIVALFPFGFPALIFLLCFMFGMDGSYDKGEVDIKNANPFRDIPCNKDTLDAFFLAKVYNLYKKKEDLFGAVILKWVLDGTVKITEVEKQGVFKTKKIVSLDMTNDYQDDTPYGKLYKILKAASKDGILESDELENYCKNNYNKLYSWFNEVELYVRAKHIEKGLITKGKKGKVIKYSAYFIGPELQEEALHLAGLKNFLKEVSLIHEKRPIEVNLWEHYLIFAQIFGMAKEVAKSFKDLYPEIVKDMRATDFDYATFIIINNFQTSTVKAMSSAKAAAESYSSGGGGSSFGGGGGGSFGGGSGGGSR